MSGTTAMDVRMPPGPEGPPPEVLAELLQDPAGAQMRWWKQYGDAWTVPTPAGPFVFLADPDMVRQLVANHLDHGAMQRRTVEAQGRGITTLHGEEWQRLRMLMNPMFSRPAMRRLVDKMVEAIDARLQRLEPLADSGEAFDISKFLGEITIRVLFHTMFSDEYSDDEIDFAVRQLDMISVYKGELMTTDWRPPGYTPEHQVEGKAAVAALDELLYNSIRRRREAGDQQDDMLGRLLSVRDEEGNGLSDQEIRDQLTVLFFGGYETTQWATAWALSFLPDHPEAKAKLLAEIDGLGGALPTEDDLNRLEYSKAVVNEALRHQGALILPRQLEFDDTFGEYRIPAGTLVGASVLVIHNRPDLWAEPEKFRPERFLGTDAREQHRFQRLAFGAGPRVCLGINLAYFEAQLMLAMFLSRYDYEIVQPWTRRGVHQYSMVLQGGLPIRLKRRERS